MNRILWIGAFIIINYFTSWASFLAIRQVKSIDLFQEKLDRPAVLWQNTVHCWRKNGWTDRGGLWLREEAVMSLGQFTTPSNFSGSSFHIDHPKISVSKHILHILKVAFFLLFPAPHSTMLSKVFFRLGCVRGCIKFQSCIPYSKPTVRPLLCSGGGGGARWPARRSHHL